MKAVYSIYQFKTVCMFARGGSNMIPVQSDSSRYCITSVDFADLLNITRQSVQQMLQKYDPERSSSISPKNRKPILVHPLISRKILEDRGYEFQKKAIAFQLLKGGVGKTSLAKNFGIRAATYGYKVLFIDMDHQANLTSSLGIYSQQSKALIDWIDNKVSDLKDLIISVSENVSIIPSTIRNADLAEQIQRKQRNIATLLATPFSELKKTYDLIICDCPPAIGAHVAAVYFAVDTVIAPVVPDEFSDEGLQEMFSIWKRLGTEFSKNINIRILINKHDTRVKSSSEKALSLMAQYKEFMYPIYIRYSSDFLTATNQKKTLWEIGKSASAASEDVDMVVRYELGLGSQD
jgi:chromosome partitioning protein